MSENDYPRIGTAAWQTEVSLLNQLLGVSMPEQHSSLDDDSLDAKDIFNLECPKCEGYGYVESEEPSFNENGNPIYGYDECSLCNGIGFVDEIEAESDR